MPFISTTLKEGKASMAMGIIKKKKKNKWKIT